MLLSMIPNITPIYYIIVSILFSIIYPGYDLGSGFELGMRGPKDLRPIHGSNLRLETLNPNPEAKPRMLRLRQDAAHVVSKGLGFRVEVGKRQSYKQIITCVSKDYSYGWH